MQAKIDAMTGIRHSLGPILGLVALVFAAQAPAQENLDRGKSPAQLYASDCAICHKSPRGLSRAGGVFGVESFLREHYTASRESAAAIAAYLNFVDRGPAAERRRVTRPKRHERSKAAAKDKAEEKKPEAPGADLKPAETKASDTKPAADEKMPAPGGSADKPAVKKPEGKAAEARASAPQASQPAAPKPANPKAGAPAEANP